MPWWPFSVDFVSCAGWREKSASETERCHCKRTWRISPHSIHSLLFVDDGQLLEHLMTYTFQYNKCNVTSVYHCVKVICINVNKLHFSVTCNCVQTILRNGLCIVVNKNILLFKVIFCRFFSYGKMISLDYVETIDFHSLWLQTP